MPRLAIVLPLVILLLAGAAAPASAIPLFAQQYGVSCEKCHGVIPHLNAFGAAFVAYGYRIPGVMPGPAAPVAVKTNLVASNQSLGDGLPKAIVDEIELLSGGAIGTRASYYFEQYAVDGGMPGALREASVTDRVNPWNARIPIYAQAGQFTLPLPIDPETFRETYQDYAPYVQQVGTNPFTFFDPHLGARLGIGDPLHGLNLQLFAGPGYDRLSGLRTTGADTFAALGEAYGDVTVTAFTYDGMRPVGAAASDAFSRNGAALTVGAWSRFSSETLLTHGWDANCGTVGSGCASSAGFEQLRYAFDRRLFALARYEGSDDPTNGFARDGVLLLGYGPTEWSRLTLEEVYRRGAPQLTVQGTVAF